MRILVTILSALFLGPVAATALDCDNAQNQHEMNACAAQYYQNADATLNAVWGGLKSCLQKEKDQWNRLVQVQRAWIALKDKQCNYEADSDWGGFGEEDVRGSGWPLGFYGCMTQMTEKRTEWLTQQYEWNCR